MYYAELLRVRRGLIAVAISFAIMTLVLGALDWHEVQKAIASLLAGHGHAVPLVPIISVAGFSAGIAASIWGLSLSEENSGHLELAWTKPVSRLRYAFGIMLVDLVGILGAFAVALVFFGIVVWTLSAGSDPQQPKTSVVLVSAQALAYALAWFGVALALTASRRKAGAYVGLAWPIGIALLVLGKVPALGAWHGFVGFLNAVNPLWYYPTSFGLAHAAVAANAFGAGNAGALLAIAAAGVAVALAQWQRLEA